MSALLDYAREILVGLWAAFSPSAVVDIGLVALVVYRVIVLIKGTRAVQMVWGLGVILLLFGGSAVFQFHTLHWMLSSFLSSIILVVVVLFQEDIRRALALGGQRVLLLGTPRMENVLAIEEVVKACQAMAASRTGALVVLERDTNTAEFVEVGVELDAVVSKELLQSLFVVQSPVHDGAAIIRRGRVMAAGCFLPLTQRTNLEKSYGTRHRAGLGLAEVTDAVVIVVSEETGKITIAFEGELVPKLDGPLLREHLRRIFEPPAKREPKVARPPDQAGGAGAGV